MVEPTTTTTATNLIVEVSIDGRRVAEPLVACQIFQHSTM